ncbi:MAG: SDR family oxidoreductase [Bauldia sp.]|uniref:SDR family oxidoreductase n=1 Tax=Bauldia sp. TaxID=2575872 RepID=UPI001DC8B4FA|nr:SDR family oxidoreductase [Bauldia sp.]MCB1495964.1 SDR family oxidoreductase [Bauldia sp.]
MSSMFDLTGRIALVTGSSKGIGLALAEAVAGAGAEVVVNSRNPDELEATRVKLADAGHKAHAYAFDVTDQDAVVDNIERIEAEVGPIDILFNNAGIQYRSPLEDFPAEAWRMVMSANLDSVFFVGQAVAKHMIPRGRGKIINTCSLGSEIARGTIAPYTAAKGGVKMLTKGMCVDWAKHGLQVNGIGPGYFKTELNRALYEDPKFDAWVKQRTPAARWGELDELKGVAVFLASDAAGFVNGHIVYVDGGLVSAL